MIRLAGIHENADLRAVCKRLAARDNLNAMRQAVGQHRGMRKLRSNSHTDCCTCEDCQELLAAKVVIQ